ncbi:hypothetical protein [Paraburkholderia sp. RAU2J]|uniref:hypothetical protein n=1 Tax=Paraburkholderia sp. RAU2J TaxID=1938810 RepID=UPI001F545ADB|nr:hypothetical protein [Paraburkholderia sp. RAU2J]
MQFSPSWFPLEFHSDAADVLAAEWQSALGAFLSSNNKLEILYGYNARNFTATPVNGAVHVAGLWAGTKGTRTTRDFGAVIACTGFMRERTLVRQLRIHVPHPSPLYSGNVELRSFHGARFWLDPDHLDRWKFNSKYRHAVKGVLVSGGGDGAMQDFQRATTRQFGLPLLKHLERCLESPIQDKYLVTLLAAEDRARRACAWGMSNPNDKTPDAEMQIWDATFESVVEDSCADFIQLYGRQNGILDVTVVDTVAATKPALQELARRVLREDFNDEPFPNFVWVTREPHLGFAYALNRFLSLFVLKLLRDGFDRPHGELRLSTSITRIVRGDPTRDCCTTKDCHGYTHHVSFEPKKQSFVPFEIIVIRHGLIFATRPYLGYRAPVKEQLVPYYIPS